MVNVHHEAGGTMIVTEENTSIVNSAIARFLQKSPQTLAFESQEDLTNEAWILLKKVEKEYDGKGKFAAFAVERLVWRLGDLIRVKSWGPRNDANRKVMLCGMEDINRVGNVDLTDDFVRCDSMTSLVQRLKSALPKTYQETFLLYYVRGYTMKEVSRQLRLSESCISQRLKMSRRILNDAFPEQSTACRLVACGSDSSDC